MTRWLRALDRRPVAELIVVGAYVLAAAWTAWVIDHPDRVALWYPPPGVAVAAVALGGRRFVVPTLLAEAVVAVLVFDLGAELGVPLTVVHVAAVGGSYAAVGLVLRRVRVDLRLPDLRQLALLVGVLLVGAVPAAVAGTTIRRLAGVLDESHLSEAVTWFEIDALGMLVLTPAILLAFAAGDRTRAPAPRPPLWRRLGSAEVVALLAVPVATVAIAERVDVDVDLDVARHDAIALLAILTATGLLAGLAGTDWFRGHPTDAGRTASHGLGEADRSVEGVTTAADGRTRSGRNSNGRPLTACTAERRRSVEILLRQCLGDRTLPLRFRPVVDLGTGELAVAEAVLHVHHDDHRPVPPSEVRTVARAAGLLEELDHLAAQTATAIAATWPARVSVSVALSADRLGDGTWYQVVADALRSSGLSPERLALAVDEEAFADDPEHAIDELRRCRELGVRATLDHLGAGRSSLATLRAVPVDLLALDPVLLAGLGASPAARAIAGAVLGVADVLELIVVAGGLETDEQVATARSLGCHLGRGDRIGRPVPADALEAFWSAPVRTD